MPLPEDSIVGLKGEWATVSEASAHFGVSRPRILELIGNGSLGECRKVDVPFQTRKVWVIPFPFNRTARPTGRPRKETS
jgi:hypothetical protein